MYPEAVTNGDEAEARRLRSQAAARGSANSLRRDAPLRKVVSREVDGDKILETLECGDTEEVRPSLMGVKLTARRRCVKCLERLRASAELEEED